MAKWNSRVVGNSVVMNYEGGKAYKPTPELELFLRAVTNFVKESKFYTTENEDFQALLEAFDKAIERDPTFVAKLVIYTREQMHLRTLPTLGLVIMANHDAYKGTGIPRKVAKRILTRPDMITEALAMQFSLYGKPIPNSLKKGIRDALTRFDRYQLAKYKCERCKVKLKDAVKLTHPRPRDDEQSQTFKDLIESNLKNERTWEAIISKEGSTKEAWERAAREWVKYRQVFAALRNLRNLIESEIDEELFKDVINVISDVKNIKKSKVYPYRYLAAYIMLNEMTAETPKQARLLNIAVDGVRKAIENLVDTIPKFDGRVLVAIDISGSMDSPVSRRSMVTRGYVAALYGTLLAKRNNADVVLFNNDIHWFTMSGTVLDSVERIIQSIGWSTYAYKVIKNILETRTHYDYIVFLTDEQVYNEWDGEDGTFQDFLNEYRKVVNSDANLITWDLAGYGTIMMPENDTRNIYIGGFSEKALDAIEYLMNSNKITKFINETVEL